VEECPRRARHQTLVVRRLKDSVARGRDSFVEQYRVEPIVATASLRLGDNPNSLQTAKCLAITVVQLPLGLNKYIQLF
jgi:hypothetical protein